MYNCKVELTLKRYEESGVLDLSLVRGKRKWEDIPSGELIYREVLLDKDLSKIRYDFSKSRTFIQLCKTFNLPNEIEAKDLKGSMCWCDYFESFCMYCCGTLSIPFNTLELTFENKLIRQETIIKCFNCGFLTAVSSRPWIEEILEDSSNIFKFIDLLTEEELRYVLLRILRDPSEVES